jgi:hypothetical protein
LLDFRDGFAEIEAQEVRDGVAEIVGAVVGGDERSAVPAVVVALSDPHAAARRGPAA